MSEGLLGWFTGQRREKSLKLIEQHMVEVLRCVSSLHELLREWAGGRVDLLPAFNAVRVHERSADDTRRETARLLAGGSEVDAVERTFLLRLMGRVDRIADWALEAARILAVLNGHEIPYGVREVFLKFGPRLETIAEATSKAIKLLRQNPLEALNAADGVERLEEEIDSLYAESRGRLLELAADLSAPVVVLLFDALNALENAADACEDSCDVVREVVVRLA